MWMITFGQYSICVLDLLTDGTTGKLSGMKIWDHLGKAVMTYIILFNQPKDEATDVWLFVAFGAIVTGSHVATLFLKWKFRDAVPPAESPKPAAE